MLVFLLTREFSVISLSGNWLRRSKLGGGTIYLSPGLESTHCMKAVSAFLISLISGHFYARMGEFMETWWSGLTYLFAKEAGPLKGLEGSNPSVSAKY